MSRLMELSMVFLKLGLTGFGGPAVHIAMMEEEVVRRRMWLTKEHFLDLIGATNLIPGPNSTEMVIHIGYIRAGIPGLIFAGLSFILPAVLITGVFAWAYLRFGSIPQIAPFLSGVKPAVISVIFTAVVRMGRTAAKNALLTVIGTGVAAASLLGANEIMVLFSGGIAGIILHRMRTPKGRKASCSIIPFLYVFKGIDARAAAAAAAMSGIAGVSLWKLGLFFLKIGSVLYGSGYVLVAFLEGGLVKDYGWLSQQQLLDAIAVGQFTPGPILSTATFVGYVISGMPGALTATAAIFLPSFIFVLILNPFIPRLRASKTMSAFLDAVNISAIALMAAVVIHLAGASLADWRSVLIASAAAIAGIRFKLNAGWLVAGGGITGWILSLI